MRKNGSGAERAGSAVARGTTMIMAALLAGSMLAGCTDEQENSGQHKREVEAQVITPVTREVELWDEYVGRFEAIERVEVRPRVSGYLQQVHFQDGAIVAEGDLLFTIDPRPFKAALDQARARVDAARAAQKLAARELNRSETLLKQRAGSQEEYDQRRQAKSAADAELAAADAALRAAALDVEFTEVRAPITGRIGEDRVNRGNLVSAQETLLTTIVSQDPIHFEFAGSERDYLNYLRLDRSGERPSSHNAPNPVLIKLDDQDAFTIRGTMDFVDNAIDAGTGTIKGRAVIDNKDGILTPGMFGRLRLYAHDPYQALLVPDAVIQFDQSRQFVWVVGADGTAQMKPVKPGRLIDGAMRIIDEGLSQNDRVIASHFSSIKPGTPVVAQGGTPAAATASR